MQQQQKEAYSPSRRVDSDLNASAHEFKPAAAVPVPSSPQRLPSVHFFATPSPSPSPFPSQEYVQAIDKLQAAISYTRLYEDIRKRVMPEAWDPVLQAIKRVEFYESGDGVPAEMRQASLSRVREALGTRGGLNMCASVAELKEMIDLRLRGAESLESQYSTWNDEDKFEAMPVSRPT